jgi:hypothetical protein
MGSKGASGIQVKIWEKRKRLRCWRQNIDLESKAMGIGKSLQVSGEKRSNRRREEPGKTDLLCGKKCLEVAIPACLENLGTNG